MARRPENELLELLDREVFNPTIAADPEEYPGAKQRELADVQKQARDTKASYHTYGSAEHIKEMFFDDLRSRYGEKQTRMLHDLGLPALPDVKDEFLRRAKDLGVR